MLSIRCAVGTECLWLLFTFVATFPWMPDIRLFQMSSSEQCSLNIFHQLHFQWTKFWNAVFDVISILCVNVCVHVQCAPIILFSSNIFFVIMVFFLDEFISCCFYTLLKFFERLSGFWFLWLFCFQMLSSMASIGRTGNHFDRYAF